MRVWLQHPAAQIILSSFVLLIFFFSGRSQGENQNKSYMFTIFHDFITTIITLSVSFLGGSRAARELYRSL